MAADNDKKTLDYGAFLADLEAKRAILDQAIASVRAVMAGGTLSVNLGDALPMNDGPASLYGGEVPIGAFLGKTIPEAAKLCLQILKKKLTTREIVDALLKGGIETTAKTSFPSIVHSILMRTVRSGGGIVKLDRSHWGLAEWYPRGLTSTNRPSSKRRQKMARKPKKDKHVKDESGIPQNPEGGVTVPEKIKGVLSKSGVELSAQEVAAKIGIRANVVAMLLAKIAKLGDAEKTANGKYRAIKAA